MLGPNGAGWRVRVRALARRFSLDRAASPLDPGSQLLDSGPLLAALDSLPDGLILYDVEQRLLFCNEQFRRLYPDAKQHLVAGRSRAEITAACRRSVEPLRTTNDDRNAEAQVRLQGGQILSISTRPAKGGGLLEIHANRSAGALWKEILAQRENGAEATIQAASAVARRVDRARSDLAATIKRELRAPANGVLGMISLLLDGELSSAQRHYAEVAGGSAEALLTILDGILAVSSKDSEEPDMECVDFDLELLVTGVIERLRPRSEAKPIALEAQIADGLPRVLRGDPGRLRQILLNLVGNAVKFTESGSVRLTVSMPAKINAAAELLFEVTDTGIGIPEPMQRTLFCRGPQTAAPVAYRQEGSGSGLATCRKLVDLMRGEIGVRSSPGHGSTFWVRLRLPVPRSATRPDDGTDARSTSGTIDQHQPRILLADDSRTNQLVAAAILRGSGCQVDLVCDGQRALEAARRLPYDLILMDVSMPDIDGLQATAQIRSLPGQAGTVPIIAMTAHAMPGDRERCIAAGMNDHISKPVSRTILIEAVNRWLPTSIGGAARPVPAPIDLVTFSQLERDTDPAALPGLIESFIGEAKNRAEAISQAAAESDIARLEHEAHALASGAQTFGITALHQHARAIEAACAERRDGEARTLGRMLPRLTDAAASALRSRLLLRT